ncbi:MAG: iron ABC transporter permease [Candidatus Nanopelagicales bacterium]
MRRLAPLLLAALPIIAVIALVAIPLVTLLSEGLRPSSWQVFSSGSTWRVLVYTVSQALVSTVLSVVIALPAAYALYRLRLPARRILLAMVTIPFVLPTVVVGLAFRELLPFAGTTAAIIVAHVFFNVGLVIRVVGSVWGQLDTRYAVVASCLGANRWQAFVHGSWPLLRPAVTAASMLVFLFTFTSFGVVLVVGDPALPTIEVEIYQRAVQRLDLDGAAALTIIQLVVVVVALAIATKLQQHLTVRGIITETAIRRGPHGLTDYAATAATFIVVVAIIIPLGSLVSASMRVRDSWGLTWYVEAISPSDTSTRATSAAEALLTSARYAVVATVIAVTLGVFAAIAVTLLRRGQASLDTVVTLPLGVSAVSIGLGLLLFSISGPIDLRGWWLLVPLGQAMVAMPIVVRIVLPVLRSIDPRLRDVAATLGASPFRAWVAVDGPLALRATAVSAGLACAVSLGEFGATAFLARADTPTVPVQIVRLLSRPGEANLGQAAALSVILIVVTAVIIGLAERTRPRTSQPTATGGW